MKGLMQSLRYLLVLIILLTGLTECNKDNNSPSNPTNSNPTNGRTSVVFNASLTYGTMTDQDGNIYKTIKIGTQTWMAENLRTTKYRNGKPIPLLVDTATGTSLTIGAYCNYENTKDLDTIATFGRLYNWYAIVDSQGIAPPGWHVPANDEWNTLTDYLGGTGIAACKLKEADTKHWQSPNAGATNESGFSALPGGSGNYSGSFSEFGYAGVWLSSTVINSGHWLSSYGRYLQTGSCIVLIPLLNRSFAYSVRLVKDN
jgi:uncharacterized protein (TIGR02145 family)